MKELDNFKLRQMNIDLVRHIYDPIFSMDIDNEKRVKIGVILLKAYKEIEEVL